MKCLKCGLIFSNYHKLLSHYNLAHPEAYEYISNHNLKPILMKLSNGNTRIKVSRKRYEELESLGLICENLYCSKPSGVHIVCNDVPLRNIGENPWRKLLNYGKAKEACEVKGGSTSVKSKNFRKNFLING